MFKFESKRTADDKEDTVSSVNESIDYANYLLEVQESKASVLKELTESTQASSYVGSAVEKKVIDVATFKKEESKL